MEFLNYHLNTPGFFGGKREVQNLGRLKNVINLPLYFLIKNIFPDISPEDLGNKLKDKITPSELCVLQSLCVHFSLMSHICWLLLSSPLCSQAQGPEPSQTQTPEFSSDLECCPGLKWCQCLEALREAASCSLCMRQFFQRCLMLWKCRQAHISDLGDAWLLLKWFTQVRVPVVCLRGIHSRSMLINSVLQDRTRGISTILYCTPREFPRRNTYWLC